ncbi:MAG: cation diffusion facilitator family transporter [Spirochaetales bacterium]|nr:cation diffusion facilitator family transporter [Spirochaetales bacterium]
MRWATYASVATALTLFLAKSGAWFMTGSLAILASLVDSLMDMAASAINMIAIHYSLKSPDKEFKFGYGKAEPLAGLVQASFITGSAVFLIFQAVERLASPQPVQDLGSGIWVILFAIGLTGILILFQRFVIKHTGSTAIKADALHYTTDILTNTATLVALLLIRKGYHFIDSVFAIGIALYILYSAKGIAVEAMHLLLDRELSPEIRKQIITIAGSPSEVIGVHDLRTRQSGQIKLIQLHLELSAHMPLEEAHALAKKVEFEIHAFLPDADIIIHQDPRTPPPASAEPSAPI